MKRLKQLAALTVLSGSLVAPAVALAEPTPPPGTTVNTIPLTTVETNVTSMGSDGTAPAMNSVPNSMPSSTNNNMDNNMAAPMAQAPDQSAEDDADMAP